MMLASSVFAAPANPFPQTVTQADGTEITLVARGDEFFSWAETMDGHVVAFSEQTGSWHYARISPDSRIVSGEGIVGNVSPRSGVRLTNTDLAGLIESADRSNVADRNRSDRVRAQPLSAAAVIPPITQYNNRQPLLVLLIEYNNRQFSTSYAANTTAFWSSRVFGTSGTTVNTYFQEMSGSFNLQYILPDFMVANGFSQSNPIPGVTSVLIQDGVARVHLNRNHPNTRVFGGQVYDDVDLAFRAVAPFLDLSAIPMDSWGDVLNMDFNVYSVIAGYDWSANDLRPANRPAVWGHFWTHRDVVSGYWRNFSIFYAGTANVELASYGTQGELYDTGIPMGVGVTVHELGHLMGLPDLYSDIPNGLGLAQYCLMSHGSWGGRTGEIDSTTPTPLSPWARYRLGFITPTRIYQHQHWTNNVLSGMGSGNVLQIVNPTQDHAQYFMVENRQLQGFDAGRALWNNYSGILIYRIDERVAAAAEDAGRTWLVNCNNFHRTVSVERFTGTPFGTQSNPFYNMGGVFDSASTPNSNFHALSGTPVVDAHVNCHPQNVPSGISVRVHSSSSNSMQVEVGVGTGTGTAITSANVAIAAPVTGAVPVTAFADPGGQWDAAITWSPAVSGAFAPAITYTATIAIMPRAGFTLTDVTANFFTINGSAPTSANLADAGSFSHTFPATGGTAQAHPITIVGGGSSHSASPNPAEAGQTVTLAVGTAPTGYQFVNWTSDDVAITNPTQATDATFVMVGMPVTVTSNWEPTITANRNISLRFAPDFGQNILVPSGSVVNLPMTVHVTVADESAFAATEVLTFQWLRDGFPIGTPMTMPVSSGAVPASMSMMNANIDHSGMYALRVSLRGASAELIGTSPAHRLSVIPYSPRPQPTPRPTPAPAPAPILPTPAPARAPVTAPPAATEFFPARSGATFAPDEPVTRGELAQAIFNLNSGRVNPAGTPILFSDTHGSPFSPAIDFVSAMGLMSGFPDGTFRANEQLSRGEAAAVLSRLYGLSGFGVAQFVDTPVTNWAFNYAALAADRGIINGFPDNTFRPSAPLTRAEAVALLVRSEQTALFVPAYRRNLRPHLQNTHFVDVPESHWAFNYIMAASVPR